MKKKFNFSVIMAIYNVDKYLDDAILSVVRQSIGFEENIQLVLVNDGSPDDSETICLKYKKLYPDNIIYIKKENGGVSSARNAGLEVATGEILNFLDSDDYFSRHAFEKVLSAFDKYENTNVVALNLINFEAARGSWVNALYFNETRFIDMFKESNFMQCQVGASFIKRDLAIKYRFNENIKIHEDTNYIYKIFCESPYCVTISDEIYWHRIRFKGNSATQTIKVKNNIFCLSDLVFGDLEKFYFNKYGFVPDFVQNLIILEYNYYVFKQIDKCVFSETEITDFVNKLNELISYIDIINIKNHFCLSSFDKKIWLLLKYDINNLFVLFPSLNKNFRFSLKNYFEKKKLLNSINL